MSLCGCPVLLLLRCILRYTTQMRRPFQEQATKLCPLTPICAFLSSNCSVLLLCRRVTTEVGLVLDRVELLPGRGFLQDLPCGSVPFFVRVPTLLHNTTYFCTVNVITIQEEVNQTVCGSIIPSIWI